MNTIEAPCPVVGCDGTVEFWALGSDHFAISLDRCEACGAEVTLEYSLRAVESTT